MAETKTSISELSAATTVGANDLLFVSQLSGSSYVSKKATVNQLPFGQGTITGITMNGTSKGTSGVVDLGTVLTAHQSLDSCLKNSEDQTISSCNRLYLMSGTMDSTIIPISSVQSPGLSLQDKNAYTVGYFLANRNSSGRQAVLIRARQPINGSDSIADIGLCIDADNTKYAYCPTPPSSSNDTKIATTAWVRSRMSGDYVSKSALTAAVAAVGAVPSGDGATLSAVIDKYNALVAALTALAT